MLQKWFFLFLVSFGTILSLFATSYNLPEEHKLQKPLAELFSDPEILASREALEKAGFQLLKRKHRGLTVARHTSLAGFLLKIYINDEPDEAHVAKYIARLRGARALQEFITKKGLHHITTPQKWLYPLKPNALGVSNILVVEEMSLLSTEESRQHYREIPFAVLEELCAVLKEFRGLDSTVKNMAFTSDGKIAFIDTEFWEEKRPHFLHRVVKYFDAPRLQIVASWS